MHTTSRSGLHLTLALCLPVALAALLGGCAGMTFPNSSGGGSVGGSGGGSGWYPPEQQGPPPYDGIPSDAQRRIAASGQYEFVAPSRGRVFVGNDDRRRRLTTIDVRRGDSVEVDPRRNRIRHNDSVVFEQDMQANAMHSVFFIDTEGSWTDTRPYDGIPRRASRVAGGSGDTWWRADDSGAVYVGNDRRRKQVMRVDVRSGDTIDVKPKRNRIEHNGSAVFSENMDADHPHSIFFVRGGNDGGSDGGNGQPPAEDRYGGIPGYASPATRGEGTLRWRANASGRIWVGNDQLRTQIVVHNIAQGEEVEVNPGADRVKINGRDIFTRNLESRHRHTVFFSPDPQPK